MRTRCLMGLALLCALAAPALAQTQVTVTGEAEGTDLRAKDMALEDAFRKAIEKGVGTYIASQSETENFVLIRDRIFAEARGLVKTYRVINTSTADGITRVTIEAVVMPADVSAKWEEIRNLIYRKKRPRLMWLLYEMGPANRPVATGQAAFVTYSARTLTGHMEEFFLKHRFFLVDREQFLANKSTELQVSQLESDLPRLIALGREQGAEVIVYGYVRSTQGAGIQLPGTDMVVTSYDVSIAAKAIRADNAKIIASLSRAYRGTGTDPNAARANALKEAGTAYSRVLRDRIIADWVMDVNVANNVQVEIGGISFAQASKVEEHLRKLRGIGQLSPRTFSNNIQIWDIESRMGSRDLAIELTKVPGVKIDISAVQANRIIAKVKSGGDD